MGQDRAAKKPKATEDLPDEEDVRGGDSAELQHPNGGGDNLDGAGGAHHTHAYTHTREIYVCV